MAGVCGWEIQNQGLVVTVVAIVWVMVRTAPASEPRMLNPNPDLKFVVVGLGDDSRVIGAACLATAAPIVTAT